jgi:hypothetical protein
MNMMRIGVIGHRIFPTPQSRQAVLEEARHQFANLRDTYGSLEVFSPLAVGADSLLAAVALEFGAKLFAVIPFTGYEKEFSSPEEIANYLRLLSQAAEIIHMPFTGRSREAFLHTGKWIVDHTDLLLAVWNGLPARSTGGTAESIAYAQSLSKPIQLIPLP